MGTITFGIPEQEAQFIKDKLRLDTFVEGGAYKGGTAARMSTVFNKVITIENSDAMHEIASVNLKKYNNVMLLKGDTRQHLDDILKSNDNILFWLDAHWSGGETYGKNDECPLIQELETIFKYSKNHAILIDDARLFLAPPPIPHNYEGWPSIKDICNTMPNSWDIIEFEDVIYLLPESVSNNFRSFLQTIITKKTKKTNSNSMKKLLHKTGLVKC